MAVGNFFGVVQKFDFQSQLVLCMLNRIAPQLAVRLHDLELVGLEPAGLEQDAVWNADFANVVQGGRLEQDIDRALVQKTGKARMPAQLVGQQTQVVLRAADVVAGVVVAGLRQGGHGQNGDILNRRQLPAAALHLGFQVIIFVPQEVRSSLDLQLGGHPRQHDGRIDGLGDEIHRAHLQPLFFLFGCRHRGQENDGDVLGGGIVLEDFAHVITRQARHHDVQQDEVRGIFGSRQLECLFAMVGQHNPVVVFEQPGHQGQVVRRVVHDQYGRFFGEVQCVHQITPQWLLYSHSSIASAHPAPR